MSDLLDFAGRKIPQPTPQSVVVVFDLDGTLADHAHRLHHLTPDSTGWDAYFAELDKDELIVGAATIYNLLTTQCLVLGNLIREQGLKGESTPFVDIVTGRPEKYRAQTVAWFERFDLLKPRALHMRPEGDTRPDNILKIDLYERIYKDKETVLAVFEDRDRVVKAWRAAGVPCFQVTDGAF